MNNQLNQRQNEILAELKEQYIAWGKGKDSYELNGINFFFTVATVPYIDNTGFEYKNIQSYFYEELEEIARHTDMITYVENTNIAMYANEHVLIHPSIIDFELKSTDDDLDYAEMLKFAGWI